MITNNNNSSRKSKLLIRNAKFSDVEAIKTMASEVYQSAHMATYTNEMLRGQISIFPEGQFVAVYDGNVVLHRAYTTQKCRKYKTGGMKWNNTLLRTLKPMKPSITRCQSCLVYVGKIVGNPD